MKNIFTYLLILALVLFNACEDVSVSRDSGSYNYNDGGVATGGSLASFVIQGNSLYTINNSQLVTYDISNPSETISKRLSSITNEYGSTIWNLETIFPYGDHLFLGANDAMYIVDVSNPASPQYVSKYEHVYSCDPVVVQNDVAYVSLRQGTRCWHDINALEVIDISDLENPKLIASYNMESPYGLGIYENSLFLCDAGKLKVLNCADPYNISLVQEFDRSEIYALDVIPNNGTPLILGEGKLNQYAFENNQLKLLSSITNSSDK